MKGQVKHLATLPWKLSWLQLQFSLGRTQVFKKLAWTLQRDLSLKGLGTTDVPWGSHPASFKQFSPAQVICFPLKYWGRIQVISDGDTQKISLNQSELQLKPMLLQNGFDGQG